MSNDPQTTLLNMARQLLTSTDDQPIERGAISEAIDAVQPMVERRTGHVFAAIEIANIMRVLEIAYVVQQGAAIGLIDHRNLPSEWYVGDRRKPGPFMSRYLQKLAEDEWPVQSVGELRDSTARVVELLDDPAREGPWNWRGLVVGDVQSGKTAHYAGVINRAVDAGYRVIIVLAGMHNLLRLQTQFRMELDFLGYDTRPDQQADGRMRAIGVGLMPPPLPVGSLTHAASNGDFNIAFARQANFAPLDQPCLFVVKKNATILRNLNGWIRKLREDFRAAPLLLIDDEADQASIDTKDQPTLSDGTFDEDYDPTKINGEIRKLLRSFARSAYVAYTATPFANILIHDERAADDYGFDLFPSTFIFSLTPPDDYFGPAAVFGTNDGAHPGLPLIRNVDQAAEAWIPDVHDKTLRPRFEGRDELPPTLREAVRCFVIGCAVRVARGRPTAHNSMLIHVSRYVDVHDQVYAQVIRYLDDLRARISANDAETLAELEALWNSDFVPTGGALTGTVFDRGIMPVEWEDVRQALADSGDKIQVIVANGRSKAGLDYDRYKETGLSVIAIGGDKLSRGLTLEGLSVSYFLRITKQYDSLLQMGRWFGYRRGFADICRLYTTPDMEDWFRHVATASKDLRADFAHMRLMLQTPRDYGLRVESHSVMSVTASNKQRHAVERPTGYAGEGKIQTVMYTERGVLEQNVAATETFLEALNPPEDGAPRPDGGTAAGLLWRGVSGEAVAAYLRTLTFPPENTEIEGSRLATYVETQLRQSPSELSDWTVLVAAGDGRTIDLAGYTLSSIIRRPLASRRSTANRYIVKSILNPPDEAMDLTQQEFADALTVTNSARALTGLASTDRPAGPEIRRVRPSARGMLIIYPLDPDEDGLIDTDGPAIGLVISFPESTTASRKFYVENTVLQREQARR